MNEFNFNRLVSYSGAQVIERTAHLHDRHSRLWHAASRLYAQAYTQGQFARLWSWLTRRKSALYDLNRIANPACPQHYAGLQSVPIRQIRGSEGRCTDFDRDFHPLHRHGQERWIGVAMALLDAQNMSPICLVKVGDIYFVRDGHHRISIARAWGQECIDAEVIVWEVPETAPCEQPVPTRSPWGALRGALAL